MLDEYWRQLTAAFLICIWLVRLEAKVKALDVKVNTHKDAADEKQNVLFKKLEKLETSTQAIEVSVAKIAPSRPGPGRPPARRASAPARAPG